MGGRARESVLATALEAVVAVIYLEAGLDAARAAVARLAVW
jgi:ribonuclease-3